MSFLINYKYHASNNECPDQFHIWCAYTVLSATISRRVWLSLEDSEIFCNLFTLLVGDAGNGKSWALSKARRMMNQINLPISGDKETPEGMLRFMAGDPTASKPIPPYGGDNYVQSYLSPKGIVEDVYPMNIFASEFIDFIKTDDIGWINMLNNIFDAPHYKYKTKNQGNDFLPGPYFTLLGALTTQTSSSMQKDQIINTGLARRTLFQYGERKFFEPKPLPEFNASHKQAYDYCIEHLKKVQNVFGPFEITGEVREWYIAWYNKNSVQIPNKASTIRSWFASKSTQLLKLAMLTSLSERFDRVLEIDHFETALAFLDILESDLFRIFGGVGQNKLNDVVVKLYNHIINSGEPLRFNKAHAQFFQDLPAGETKKSLQECFDQLVRADRLVAHKITYGAIVDVIYGTKPMIDKFIEFQNKKPEGETNPLPVLATAPANYPAKPVDFDSASAEAPSVQPLEVPPALPQVDPASTDPLTLPAPNLPLSVESPASAQSLAGTKIVPLPTYLLDSN